MSLRRGSDRQNGRTLVGESGRGTGDSYFGGLSQDSIYTNSQPAAVAKALGLQPIVGQGRAGPGNGKAYASRALLEYCESFCVWMAWIYLHLVDDCCEIC